MTLSTIPTYIPIKDAAKKYGYTLADLKSLAQSGKIKAVKLPGGDMVVSENSVKEKLKKEDLPEYKKYKGLAKNPIWLSEAERKYAVSTPTLSRWVKAGYISRIGLDGNRVLLNEQDVCVFKAFGQILMETSRLPDRIIHLPCVGAAGDVMPGFAL